jgi:outer membrane protein assembly factor BamB
MAGMLILFVLVGSVVLQLSGAMQGGSLQQEALWETELAGGPPETLKAIDLTGDGEDEVFVQTPEHLKVLSPEGETLLEQFYFGAKSTMGDLDGDGTDEFAVAESFGPDIFVSAWKASGDRLWEVSVSDTGEPSRGMSIDFEGDGSREVLFGTVEGVLVCLNGTTGELRWRYEFSPDTAENMLVRGSDDVVREGRRYMAAAVYGGEIVLLDGNREVIWQLQFPEQLRRLRAYDMDGDGTSEIFLGGLNGLVQLVSARDGELLWSDSIGSRVNEARFLELDGDPTGTELVVGGRNGGVLAFNRTGEILWSRSVGGKVLEFTTLDYDEDGQNELLVSADNVNLLEASSGSSIDTYLTTEPTTMDVGDFGKRGTYLVGSVFGVTAVQVSFTSSPWWYSPITAGLLLAVVIAAIAVWFSRIEKPPEAPKVTYTVQEMSLEALKARKKMLREVLEDIERMQDDGTISSEVYLARSRSTRAQMASIDEQILEIQPDYKPDTVKCPSCGAPVGIGADRCPYCSHVLL